MITVNELERVCTCGHALYDDHFESVSFRGEDRMRDSECQVEDCDCPEFKDASMQEN